jgi:hypothetical protein
MDQREELAALRRLAELEAKAKGGTPQAQTARVPQRTSQALGFGKGLFAPVDNASRYLESAIRSATDGTTIGYGLNTASQALRGAIPKSVVDFIDNPQAYYEAQSRAGVRPGKIGEFAGNVVGTLPASVVKGGSAAVGGVQGALLSDKRDPLGVLTDAAIGAAGGLVGEGVAKGLGYAGGKAMGAMRSNPAINAQIAKADRYIRQVAKASGADPADLMAASPDITAAEALGQTGKAQLGALARRPGLTGESLTGTIEARRLARPDVLQSEFGNAIGIHPSAAAGDIRSLVDQGRKDAAPLYEQAYAAGPIQTPGINALLSRPSMKKAMAKAVNLAAENGENPNALGFVVSQGSGDIPEMVSVSNPTMKTWDWVKRGLDDVLESERDKNTGRLPATEDVQSVVRTLKAFRTELTNANPAYKDALATSGDYLGAKNAFEKGQKLVFNSKIPAYDFGKTFSELTPANQQAFKGGIANSVFDLAQTGRLKPETLRTPLVRSKLAAVLGKPETDALIASAEKQAKMAAFETRYGPAANSITQEMADAMRFQDDSMGAAANVVGLMQNPKGTLTNMALQKVQGAIDWATQPKQIATRDIAGGVLMDNPQALARSLVEGLPRQPSQARFNQAQIAAYRKAMNRLARPSGMFGSTMALQNQGQR